MNDGKVKVLYIAGNGRSGSTILGVVLGQLTGFFAVGELRRVWDQSLAQNDACGCGLPFRECETWRAIFQEAFGGFDAVDASQMTLHRDRFTQTKHLPPMLFQRPGRWAGRHPDRVAFCRSLNALYGAIGRRTGCRVIVDASKWPMYAYALQLLPAVELYVLHLTRDPRAVAFSWGRPRDLTSNNRLPRQHPLKTTAYWLAWNPAIRLLWKRADHRYLHVSYEGFVRDPLSELGRIVRFVDEDMPDTPLLNGHTVRLAATHTVAGNIARLAHGPVRLQVDDEWKRKMGSMSKLCVSALTWPWLPAYGDCAPPA